MNKISKIAIVTLYDNINIGNKLQNYATQELLKKYANEIKTLSYSEAAGLAPDMGWKGKIIAKIGIPPKIAKRKKAILNRRKKFQKFSEKYLDVAPAMDFKSYNRGFSDKYDLYVVGSDQVWHNWSLTKEELDFFFLKFAKRNQRICLAPSFGFRNINKEFELDYKEGLQGFNIISCREESGCKLIENLTGKKALLLPDPTLCLDKNRWIKMASKPKFFLPDKFALVYFIGGKSRETEKQIKNISQKEKLNIIDILDISMPVYYTTSPDEFIYLISRATRVFTDSYHATVFSIIFHVQFNYFKRNDSTGKEMGDRMETLFNMFNINQNYSQINYKDIDTILLNQKSKMDSYLKLVFGD